MRSIKIKILLIIIISAFISYTISSSALVIFIESFSNEVFYSLSDAEILEYGRISLIIYGVILLILFVSMTMFLFDRYIIKRLKYLELQTKKVIQGDFEDHIEMNQKDEIGSLARTYKIMLSELRKNEYLNRSFIRNYSHEIKTPLSSINGYASLISETKDLEKIYNYSNIIMLESNRLALMSVDLLSISELDTKEIIIQNDEVDISELLRNIILSTEPLWSSKSLEFDLEIEEIMYKTNKALLYSVFSNMISNAVKYAPSKTKISISLTKKDAIELKVVNIGSISEENLSKIYDLFYTTNINESTRSSGVGLALVNKIVKKINASISCESKDNKVLFTLRLR